MQPLTSATGFSGALVHLCGFLFVLLVLTMLWVIIEAIGLWFKRKENPKKSAAPASHQETAGLNQRLGTEDELPEEHLVVIASVVALMLGNHSRVLSVRPADGNWGREGRRELQHSHGYRLFK